MLGLLNFASEVEVGRSPNVKRGRSRAGAPAPGAPAPAVPACLRESILESATAIKHIYKKNVGTGKVETRIAKMNNDYRTRPHGNW